MVDRFKSRKRVGEGCGRRVQEEDKVVVQRGRKGCDSGV